MKVVAWQDLAVPKSIMLTVVPELQNCCRALVALTDAESQLAEKDAEIAGLKAATVGQPMLLGAEMTKEQSLDLIKLLSALESWSFSAGQRLPDYLYERIADAMGVLTEEVLK